MRTAIFNSCFKEDMQSFMEYRIATYAWNTYRLDNYRLSSFDRFLTEISYDEEIVPQSVINQWLGSENVPDASVNGYIKTIRNFMKYRADMGKAVYLPPFQKKKDLYIPYIFSDDELTDIFTIADAYPVTNRSGSIPHTHMEVAVLIRLLYCCGLRLGEALDLKTEHLDFENGVLRIVHSKNKKQRFVPMHETLTDMLADYYRAMKIYGINNAFLFPGKSGHLSPITAERKFKSILKKAGIIKGNEDPHKRAPCLHCLRHCFMFHAFKKLEAAGYHVDMASPYLSVYCGHESLVESEKYMKFSSELFEEEMLLFADFTKSLFPEVDL